MEPVKESQISTEIDNILHFIDNLEVNTGKLVEKLACVCHGENLVDLPDAENKKKDDTISYVPLAMDLRVIKRRIECLNFKIENVLDNIEL